MNRVVTGYTLGSRAVGKQSTVTKLDFLKTKFVIKLLVLLVFAVILALFYIWSRIQIVQLGYEINEHQNQYHEILVENRRLEMELALMKSPDRLQEFAAQKIGMQYPEVEQIKSVQVKNE
ncbi:MAG: cell division protein FtsL [Deltaproteobacteria bacterium]|nr:cell division protein FtsL [Deltaproteobacteria bacterium]